MKRTRSLVSSVAVLAAATLTPAAFADVPPPPGYVETCTVERQQRSGESCMLCGESYHGDRDACQRRYEPEGYEMRCRTPGASVWRELWCRTGEPVIAVPPTPNTPPVVPDGSAEAAPPAEASGANVVAPPLDEAAHAAHAAEAAGTAVADAAATSGAAPAASTSPEPTAEPNRTGCAATGGPLSSIGAMFSLLALVPLRRRRS